MKALGLAHVVSQSPTRHRALQWVGAVCRDLSRAAKGRLEKKPGSTALCFLLHCLGLLVTRGAEQETSCCCC